MKRGIILVIITIVLFIAAAVGIYTASGSLFKALSENIPAVSVSPEPEDSIIPESTATPAPAFETPTATTFSSVSPALETSLETPVPTIVPAKPEYYDVYEACLSEILTNDTYPEDKIPELLGGRTLNEPLFAVRDIDQDGIQELLIQVTTMYSKGGIEAIYQCEMQDGNWCLVLQNTYYPLVTYYDNGLLLAGWQDGNGKEPDGFWPYDICRYNEDTGIYDSVGYVYSDNIYGDCFMINLNGEWYYGNTDYYNQWFTDFIGTSLPMDITYLTISEDNIQSFFHS